MTTTTGRAVLDERQTRRVLLTVFTAVPFVVAIIALLRGWELLGDNAIIGIRVRSLLAGDLPLTGLPSTGENFGTGIESSHPGPLALYLLVPFVVVFGQTAGMAFGAAAINASAFGLAVWAGYRRGGVFLMSVVGFMLCLLARGLSPWTLVDPLSSNLGTFQSVAYALLVWAVLQGDRRLLPVALIVGSFTFQAHLTYMAFGAAVSAVLIIGLTAQVVRDRDAMPERRTLVWSGLALGIVWLPVLLDQFFGGGNLSSIVRTFTGEGGDAPMGSGFALKRLVHAVAFPPFFAQDVRGLDFLAKTPLAMALTGLPGAVVVGYRLWSSRGVDRRRRVAGLPMLVIVTVVVGLVSVYSAAQLPSGATVKAANLRWMWTFGALWWTTVIWAVIGWLLERFGRPRPDRIVPVLLGTAVIGMVLVLVQSQVRPARDAQAFEVAAELRREAEKIPDGRYRVTYEGGKALLTVGPAFAYSLRSTGSEVFVDAGQFGRGYGSGAIYTDQDVDRTFLVVAMPADEFLLPVGFDVLLRTSYVEGGKEIETALLTADGAAPQLGELSGQIEAFCRQTEAISEAITGFNAAREGPGAGDEITAGEVADLFDSFHLDELEPTDMPDEIRERLERLLDHHEEAMTELRLEPDRPVTEVVDPQMITDLVGLAAFWQTYCQPSQ